MTKPFRLAGAVAMTAALLGGSTTAAHANPPGSQTCPPGTIAVNETCVPIDDDPVDHDPTLWVTLAQQNASDRGKLTITGSAKDPDSPTAALQVSIAVDGLTTSSLTTSSNHGFTTTKDLPASAQSVCLTAINTGDGANTKACRTIDRIDHFEGTAINYDVDHAVADSPVLDELDRLSNTNATTVQQSTTISGSKTLKDTSDWSDTESMKITLDASVKIPLVAEGEVKLKVTPLLP